MVVCGVNEKKQPSRIRPCMRVYDSAEQASRLQRFVPGLAALLLLPKCQRWFREKTSADVLVEEQLQQHGRLRGWSTCARRRPKNQSICGQGKFESPGLVVAVTWRLIMLTAHVHQLDQFPFCATHHVRTRTTPSGQSDCHRFDYLARAMHVRYPE